MKAVILTAGNGNRMLPLTRTHIKSMLPVGGIPFLHHIINNVKDVGITEFIIVTENKHNSIHEYFKNGDEFNISIEYVPQKTPLGTAHAIGLVKPYVDDKFIVLSGDTIVPTEELKLMLGLDANILVGTMVVENNQHEYGLIEHDGQYISKIIEKPEFAQTYLVNAGIYIFDQTIFESISKTGKSIRNEFEITGSIQQLIDYGGKIPYTVFQEISHISYPWDLLDYNVQYMSTLPDSQLIEGNFEFGVNIKGPVIIRPGARVRGGTYIEGPVIIGQDCDIGPNCYIRPYTSLGKGVRIGSAVEVKNSIIMDWTHVGHFSYIGDSIIGINCNFGAGTQVANLRHDNDNINVMIDGVIVDSGRRKLGTIMGDNVHTGINSMLNAGSVIEPGSKIMPGEFVKSCQQSS